MNEALIDTTPEEIFSPLIGQLAWCVKPGYGTFLTMEFGEPHLYVREPIQPRRSSSEKALRGMRRRQVTPTGDWHFWIYMANWKISTGPRTTSSTEEDREVWMPLLEDISGQRLLSAKSSKVGCLTLRFDLGGVVEIWPTDEGEDDLWTLHLWTGDIFSCRPDGTLEVEHHHQ